MKKTVGSRLRIINPLQILFLLLGLSIPSIVKAEEPPTLNQRVKNLSQQALPYEEEEWDGDSFYEFLSQTLKNQLMPTKMRKHTLAFKLINNAPSFTNSFVQEDTTWTDLNFFAGKRVGEPSVCSKLDRTLTSLGKAQFYTLCGAVSNNAAEIKQRQAIIKFFVDNPQLCTRVRETLKIFSDSEPNLLSFWHRDPLMHRINDHYEFKDELFKNFNDNEHFLAGKYTFKTAKTLTNLGTEVAGTIILSVYAISQLLPNPHDAPTQQLRHLAAEHKRRNILLSYLWHKDLRVINFAIAAAGAYYLYTSFLESVEWLTDLAMYDEALHLKIKNLYITLLCLEELTNSLPPELLQIEPLFTQLQAAFPQNVEKNSDFAKLISLLQSQWFAPDSLGLVAHRGKLILSYKLMHRAKEGLIQALQLLSLLDCYTALATLIKENPNAYCFAEFEDASTPHLYLEDFTNPLLPQEKAVSNTLDLGNNAPSRNCVITGPNAGGKSTLIKAVGINALLAQSIGLAAARRCVLTPFSFVATYLNITDDINAGNSLFKAEVLRTQELINTMHTLPAGQYGLLIFDEIFNGTTPTEGSAAAYAVAKRLGSSSNGITAVATHFELLTRLESLPECSFKNYKVSVTINPDGSLTYPFKLAPGTSHQHIAINVLRSEGYENEILEEAERILQPQPVA